MNESILTFLRAEPGKNAPEIVKHLSKDGGKVPKQEVNQALYKMKTKGLCTSTTDQPPRWSALAITGCPQCGCTGDCRAESKVAPVEN